MLVKPKRHEFLVCMSLVLDGTCAACVHMCIARLHLNAMHVIGAALVLRVHPSLPGGHVEQRKRARYGGHG